MILKNVALQELYDTFRYGPVLSSPYTESPIDRAFKECDEKLSESATFAYIQSLENRCDNLERSNKALRDDNDKLGDKVIKLNKYDIYESPSDPAHSYSEQFQYDAYTNNTKESILTKNKGLSQSAMRLAPPSVKNGTSGVSPSASLIDAYELKDGESLGFRQYRLHRVPKLDGYRLLGEEVPFSQRFHSLQDGWRIESFHAHALYRGAPQLR